MHSSIETLTVWLAFLVCPAIVLSVRMGMAQRRARESEKIWKIVEKYIV
jgi:hypothetical protein